MKLFTDPYDRFLLALLNQVWLESPVLFNDTYEMPLEEVLKLREAATISFHGSKGSSVYWFTTKVSLDKYVEGVNINKAAIFDVVLSAKMLKSKLDAMIGDYPSLKKRSYAVRSAMKGEMLATEDYPEMLSHDFIERHRLAKELKKQLDSDPDGVIRMLDRVRKRMISPQNTFVYLGEDLKLLVRILTLCSIQFLKLYVISFSPLNMAERPLLSGGTSFPTPTTLRTTQRKKCLTAG